MKAQRQSVLVDMVRRGEVTSQSQAVRLLADRGITATQATVSRDLDEIGAVRLRDLGGFPYSLADEQAASAYGAPLGQVLREFVVSAVASGNLAVLHTPPGHASVVAAALDREALGGIVGTIAGDDTLFVCGAEGVRGAGVLKILDAAGSRGSSRSAG